MTKTATRVTEAIDQLKPYPADTPIVRQINAKTARPFEGFDECFWNPQTNEALSIDDVDVDPAFVRAVLIFVPDNEFQLGGPEMAARIQAEVDRVGDIDDSNCTAGGYHDWTKRELKRLTDALHERFIHPDFEYATTKTARKSGDSRKPEGDGWEPNIYGDDPHSAWERFEFHEEEYWRRRKPKTP